MHQSTPPNVYPVELHDTAADLSGSMTTVLVAPTVVTAETETETVAAAAAAELSFSCSISFYFSSSIFFCFSMLECSFLPRLRAFLDSLDLCHQFLQYFILYQL